jgi:hypothetical protein
MAVKTWQSYEEVSRYLLNEFAEQFNLGRVEGKQIIPGKSTPWEIDAKGVKDNEEAFVIIECRRYTTSRLKQEDVAAIAYKIQDCNADGGIIVSPLELQAGAKAVAKSSNIVHVILSPDSTTTDYLLQFLNKIFVGISDSLSLHDSVKVQIIRDGIIKDENNP